MRLRVHVIDQVREPVANHLDHFIVGWSCSDNKLQHGPSTTSLHNMRCVTGAGEIAKSLGGVLGCSRVRNRTCAHEPLDRAVLHDVAHFARTMCFAGARAAKANDALRVAADWLFAGWVFEAT